MSENRINQLLDWRVQAAGSSGRSEKHLSLTSCRRVTPATGPIMADALTHPQRDITQLYLELITHDDETQKKKKSQNKMFSEWGHTKKHLIAPLKRKHVLEAIRVTWGDDRFQSESKSRDEHVETRGGEQGRPQVTCLWKSTASSGGATGYYLRNRCAFLSVQLQQQKLEHEAAKRGPTGRFLTRRDGEQAALSTGIRLRPVRDRCDRRKRETGSEKGIVARVSRGSLNVMPARLLPARTNIPENKSDASHHYHGPKSIWTN